MADYPKHPLTEGHLAQIQNALQLLQHAEQQVALMKQAGIPTAQYEPQIADYKARYLALKNTYFPNR